MKRRKRSPSDLGSVRVVVTQEMIDRAKREGLSGSQLMCLAIQAAIPDATEIEVNGQNLWSPGYPSI